MDRSVEAGISNRQESHRPLGGRLVLVALAVALAAVVLVDETAGPGSPATAAAALVAFAALTASLWLRRERASKWIPPLSPAGLGLFRIAWAAALVHALSILGDNLLDAAVPAELHRRSTALDFGVVPLAEHPGWVDAIQSITLVALILFALGVFARASYLVAASGFVVLAHVLVTVRGGSHDWGLPIVTILLLVVIPWGRGFGIDETIRRLRGRESPSRIPLGLALWLPGLMLGLAWAAAAFAKLDRSGTEWITGGAIKYHFVEDAAAAPVEWGTWIAARPGLAVAVAAGGFLFEAAFLLNVFFSRPLLRIAFGLSAVAFFAGTVLFQGVYWFTWWMLLLAFLPWQALVDGARRLLPRVTLLVDGGCPLCRRTARGLYALDWFDRLAFADANEPAALAEHAPGARLEEVLRRMAVVPSGGDVRFGYDGYVTLARSVPLLWPFALLGPLPGIRHGGEAVYDRIAARRGRDHCNDETCAPGTVGGLPRVPHRPARFAVAGLAVWALVSAVVVQQVVASDRRFEREPLVSDYPMYAWTFVSTAAFDTSRERKLSRYRIEAPTREDVTQRLAALGSDEYVLDLALRPSDGWPALPGSPRANPQPPCELSAELRNEPRRGRGPDRPPLVRLGAGTVRLEGARRVARAARPRNGVARALEA